MLTARAEAAAMPTIAGRSVQPELHPASGNSDASPTRRPALHSFDAPPPPPSPARELARRALDVLRRASLASPPERWLRPGFGREVDLVRLHLGPVRTRAALAGSFGREAFNFAADDRRPGVPTQNRAIEPDEAPSIGPAHVAYALRWLELGDGRRRAAFIDWLSDPTERTLR
jgi:hypothetical protein